MSRREELIGSIGEVVDDCAGGGWARVHGEGMAGARQHSLKAGQLVRVVQLPRLVLEVVPESGQDNSIVAANY